MLLRYTGYGMIALGAISAFVAVIEEELIFLAGTISACLLGIGFVGAAQALAVLTEIRDAVAPRQPAQAERASEAEIASPRMRSLEEIEGDIKRFKGRAG